MARIAVVYHSGSGRTGLLAQAIHRGVLSVPGVEADLIEVSADQLDGKMRWRDDDAMARLQAADGMVFGCTTLMGMPSAPFKAFMEAAFEPWYRQGWKDKFATGFTNSASLNGDKTNTLIQLLVFAAQMGMIWMPMGDHPGANWTGGGDDDVNRLGSFLGPMGQSLADVDPEHSVWASDLKTGERHGARFAAVVRQWLGEARYETDRVDDPATVAARKRRAAALAPA